MKNFIVYVANGKILRHGTCQDELLNMQALDNEFVIEAEYQQNTYIKDGVVTTMPEKPDGNYKFDYESVSWLLDEASAQASVIFTRDQLLKEGPDRISPLWWNSMTTDQQQAWMDYRQALLDITKQPGYPAEVTWPLKPE